MSEVSKIFERGLTKEFKKGVLKTARTFYFSLDDEKWTVALSADACKVTKGKATDEADCVFKSTAQMFLDIWSGAHSAGMKDFMSGRIKSNNPTLLKEFMAAFGKQA
jgi:putative sterol carrier protein